MVRNMIKILPDGPVIGDGGGMNVRQCSLVECVNAETELVPGSVCCASLEATVQVDGTRLEAGTEVALYKVEDDGTPVAAGTFTLEKTTRISAALCKITAYDHVAKLDVDLSEWLKGLDQWPYTLIGFAGMVCKACGLELGTTEIPNGSFPVRKFYRAGVTGRQLLQWAGEMACRFCRADPQGRIVLEWYRETDLELRSSGDRYYFAGSLTFEDYEVAAVDAVKVALADSDAGALWPAGAAENPYVIRGNPLALVDEDLISYLEVIHGELAALPGYRPCKVSLPAAMDIRAGDVVTVVDRYGVAFRTCVMTRTQAGQRDTLECTGSAKRGSTTAANNKSVGQVAQDAVDSQTQAQIFNKLTNGGEVQGLFMLDGQLYINASYLTTGILASKDGSAFYLDLDRGILRMQATELSIGGKSVEDIAGDAASGATGGLTQKEIFNKLTNGQADQGIYLSGTNLYLNASCMKTGTLDAGTVDVQNLSASKIKTGTLDASKVTVSNLSAGAITAGVLKSSDGKTYFDLSGGSIVTKADGGYYVSIGAGAVALKDSGGGTRVMISRSGSMYCVYLTTEDGKICGFSVDGNDFYLVAPNGDGTGTIGYRPCWKTIDGNMVLTTC